MSVLGGMRCGGGFQCAEKYHEKVSFGAFLLPREVVKERTWWLLAGSV